VGQTARMKRSRRQTRWSLCLMAATFESIPICTCALSAWGSHH